MMGLGAAAVLAWHFIRLTAFILQQTSGPITACCQPWEALMAPVHYCKDTLCLGRGMGLLAVGGG